MVAVATSTVAARKPALSFNVSGEIVQRDDYPAA